MNIISVAKESDILDYDKFFPVDIDKGKKKK